MNFCFLLFHSSTLTHQCEMYTSKKPHDKGGVYKVCLHYQMLIKAIKETFESAASLESVYMYMLLNLYGKLTGHAVFLLFFFFFAYSDSNLSDRCRSCDILGMFQKNCLLCSCSMSTSNETNRKRTCIALSNTYTMMCTYAYKSNWKVNNMPFYTRSHWLL